MENILIHVGSYVIIKGRVIECPSISKMEDMMLTRTLGRDEAAYYCGWTWGGLQPTPE